MYSKLIIRVDNQEVIFHAHEVVKIAMDFHETFEATREEISDNLIQSLEEHLEEEFDIFSRSLLKAYGNKYNINPDQLKQFLDQIYDISLNAPSSILYVFSSWTEVLDYIKSKKAEDPNFEGFLTKQVTRNFLPIPPPIAGINKIEKWRGISCFLREASKKPPLLGWWFLVAGRLIHINNNEWHKIQIIL